MSSASNPATASPGSKARITRSGSSAATASTLSSKASICSFRLPPVVRWRTCRRLPPGRQHPRRRGPRCGWRRAMRCARAERVSRHRDHRPRPSPGSLLQPPSCAAADVAGGDVPARSWRPEVEDRRRGIARGGGCRFSGRARRCDRQGRYCEKPSLHPPSSYARRTAGCRDRHDTPFHREHVMDPGGRRSARPQVGHHSCGTAPDSNRLRSCALPRGKDRLSARILPGRRQRNAGTAHRPGLTLPRVNLRRLLIAAAALTLAVVVGRWRTNSSPPVPTPNDGWRPVDPLDGEPRG